MAGKIRRLVSFTRSSRFRNLDFCWRKLHCVCADKMVYGLPPRSRERMLDRFAVQVTVDTCVGPEFINQFSESARLSPVTDGRVMQRDDERGIFTLTALERLKRGA